jgi:signal transduction histidine kinase
MDTPNPSKRAWVMTIRRFAEVAWTRHGPTRYLSVALTPILVALLVPGWWWAWCSAGAVIGVIIDLRGQTSFARLYQQADALSEEALRTAVRGRIISIAVITGSYVLPYAALAFAPQPGPVLGLIYCAGGAIVCATLHVMTRTMIFYTIPTILLGVVLNAFALADGLNAYLLAAAGALVGLNAIVAARGGARSFGDLIAARLKAEEAAETLERRVEERTAQLAIATQRAQAANKAKSVFLANMSHELRTPLNAVIGYSELVAEDLESGDTRGSAADLAKIKNSAHHLLTLINEVLDLSRIEAGKIEIKPAPFDLPALLRGAIDVVKPVASKNGTELRLEIAGHIGRINADETRVRQCVLNLLSNAVKFTQAGAVSVELRPCRIGGAPGAAIAVRDTGAGISDSDLARLFQPFVQVDATKTRAHDGAGLGLVITRRLARAMGGDVVAKSELGKGSVFTLYLPLDVTAAAPVRAA